MKTYDCVACKDTGVYETGNNDFPCSCKAGLTAKFNVCGRRGPVTGAELRAEHGRPFVTDQLAARERKNDGAS